MFHNAKEFSDEYGWESQTTAKVLGAVTDQALSLKKAEGHNTLGELAWHIATSPAFILNQCGYDLPAFGWETPSDLNAEKIQQTYNEICGSVAKQTAAKSEEELNKVYRMFDMFDWTVKQSLRALCSHEIHHRGQLSVLLRQAGTVVPSIYGPNYEETQEFMKKMSQSGQSS